MYNNKREKKGYVTEFQSNVKLGLKMEIEFAGIGKASQIIIIYHKYIIIY